MQNSPTRRPSQTIRCVPVNKSYAIQRKENVQKQNNASSQK